MGPFKQRRLMTWLIKENHKNSLSVGSFGITFKNYVDIKSVKHRTLVPMTVFV